MLLLFLLILAAVVCLIYWASTLKFDHWKKQNVPYLQPTPIFGNYGPYILLKKYFGQVAQDIFQKFPEEPYVGTFYGTEPALLVQDPEIIKLITTKDFYYFNSREIAKYTHKEVITQNLFFTYGDKWKAVRQNMTPLFSSAKMRNMFPLIVKCSHSFEDFVDQQFKSSDVVEIRSLMTRFTMACICSCAFGADVDTFSQENTENTFLKIGKLIFLSSTARGFMNVARAIWPYIFYKLRLKNFPDEMVHFFKSFVTDVFKARGYNPTNRHDFVDLLLNLREQKSLSADCMSNVKTGREDKIELPITDDLLVAQCVLFFAAGYETSSTTLAYVLYELAKKPEVMEKVAAEVDEFLVKSENRLTYDCVTELPYTQACIDEALRLHPVLGVITREVVDDYTLPTGLHLKKGMRIHIPVYHLHHNPDFFPDPEEFRPARFLPENRNDIRPHTYIPFGDGPRICIGMRFAKMQMLAGLVTLFKKYQVEMTKDTPEEIQYEPRSIVTIPTGLLQLRLVPRKGYEDKGFVK